MSNSREQSLDENAVFLEVTESSPEFLYSERERQAVETLLGAGPEAFYRCVGTERSCCFLSPEEVRQISSWAQDYRFKQVHWVEDEREGSSQTADLCSTYFPCNSDTPAPDLDLGWPERGPWLTMGSVTVHTSPPADGQPHVREIIRQHLQRATQVIAVVTDRLTDGVIIGDLHNAASRAVPVYIILNQRSIQEDFTLNRLQHPNIRVRVLGGKSFCSRTGRTVVGEMKDNFLLVDLETVIHGSYSLTWTDAHLHRQLITILHGPVVDSFDQEFRILFAASLLVKDTPRVPGSHTTVTQTLREFSDFRLQRQFSFPPEIINPPSPPSDSLLDWEAMGVFQREESFPESPIDQREEIVFKEISQKNSKLLSKNQPTIMDDFTSSGNQFVDYKRVTVHTSPVINHVPDKSTLFNNIKPSPSDLTPERMKRVERVLEKNISRQFSEEKKTNLDDRIMTRFDDKTTEPMHNMVTLLSNKRRETQGRGLCVEEGSSMDGTGSKVENKPSSRKPIILRVPQSESFSSLSDIMKKIQPQQSTSRLLRKESNTAASELSQSMMDLSVYKTDPHQDERVPVPRFKASQCFDSGFMTPAFTLMKKRNDDLKSSLYRTPTNLLPRERPRSSSYGLNMDWRRSLAERDSGEQE